MQTFLPYGIDFKLTAKCLDYKRLGKQRVEAKQIISTLENGGAWKNHPAVLMWRKDIILLKHYYNCIVREWINRGYKNTMLLYDIDATFLLFPDWLKNPNLSYSHRANLLRKNFQFYSSMGWGIPEKIANSCPYWWPVDKKDDEWSEGWDIAANSYVQQVID